MKAQDYKNIKYSNEDTSKVLTQNEVVWENPKWWIDAKNIANPRLDVEVDKSFYRNRIALTKEFNNVYVKWNESALHNLNKLDSSISVLSVAFFTENNGKAGDFIASLGEKINTNNGNLESIQTIRINNLIKFTRLNRTELLVGTYCKTILQFNFWVYADALRSDLNRINNIIGLVIAAK